MMKIAVVAIAAVLVVAATFVASAKTNKFLDEVMAADSSVLKLKSGMLLKVLKKGTGTVSPTVNDDCIVHYHGTLPDGTKFDSSVDRGSPATFKPSQVIKGWTIALQLMRAGDKFKVYLPPSLAYGDAGAGGLIQPGATLVFEMELLKVKAKGRPVADAEEEFLKQTGKAYADVTV